MTRLIGDTVTVSMGEPPLTTTEKVIIALLCPQWAQLYSTDPSKYERFCIRWWLSKMEVNDEINKRQVG